MILKEDFYYPPADSYRKLHIYLPDDYASGNNTYPVMYFFDGHNLFFDQDATFGRSWRFLDYLHSWNKDLIFVGMECSHCSGSSTISNLPSTAVFPRFRTGNVRRSAAPVWGA